MLLVNNENYWLTGNTLVFNPNLTNIHGDFTPEILKNTQSIILPEKLEVNSRLAFEGFHNVNSIHISKKNPKFITIDGVLFLRNMKELIKYPCCKKEKVFLVPEGVELIGAHAFSHSKALVKVVLPNSLKNIALSAFNYCNNLQEISIPKNILYISDFVFANCSSLENVELYNGLLEMGNHVFWNCENIKKIILPDSLEKIGWGTFAGCSMLRDITFGNNLSYIPAATFDECFNLRTVVFGDNVSEIHNNAFVNLELRKIKVNRSDSPVVKDWIVKNNVKYINSDLDVFLNGLKSEER